MTPIDLPRKPLARAVRKAIAPVMVSLPLAMVPLAAKATINPLGNEFFVNSTVTNDQDTGPTGQNVVIAPDGDFIVVWTDDSGLDGYGEGVFVRIFNADGTPQTGEIQVNTTTANNQEDPAVAVDGDGDFVVAWESDEAVGYYEDIFARTFNAAGTPTSGEIPVNTTTANDQNDPSVAMDTDGDFVVAWESYNQDGYYYDSVFARTFSAAGAPTSGEIAVNSTAADDQSDPSAAMDDDGDFAISWESNHLSGYYSDDVFVRTFSAAGAPTSGEIQVNTSTDGTQDNPSIAMDADGDFVVAWEDEYGYDGDYSGVFYRTFSAAGAPTSGELQANQTTTSYQSRPSVSMQSDGDFVIAWNSYLQDGDDYGIWARDFNADGSAAGPEVKISQQNNGDQEDASVAVSDDGDVVVVFRSGDDTYYDVGPPRAGGDQNDVIARRFTLNPVASAVPVDNPVALAGLASGLGLLGAAALRRRRRDKR
ncbi:MAG: hypothetical protein HKN19_12705 [Halioglobus sp.]|nr:hypothetical protein [Halioglobus sp.]